MTEITEMTFTQVVRRLKELKEQEADVPLLWARFDELADEVAKGESFKFVDAATEFYGHRMVAHANPRVDTERLEELLTHEQWLRCTEQRRVFTMEKLTEAVAKRQIPEEKVAAATEQPAPSIRHRADRASVKDLAATEK